MAKPCTTTGAQSWQEFASLNNAVSCGANASSKAIFARKNPHFLHVMSESVGTECMYGLPSSFATPRVVAPVALALLALFVAWLVFPRSLPLSASARDFEECAEQVEAKSPSGDERAVLMTGCSARFAGRRKAGGGYTYYDFMQDRKFDIAGPNPTAEERRVIDRAYMGFLDAHRREAISSEFANRQNEQLQATLESARQPIGAPMILTPKSVPLPVKRPADRSKSAHCEDGSLTCSWAKFSTVVKNAFASSSRTKP
jgi:hypothetical protein